MPRHARPRADAANQPFINSASLPLVPANTLTIDRGTRIGNGADPTGMDDFCGNLTPRDPAWPGWGKAAFLVAASIAAWASLILPAIYFLG